MWLGYGACALHLILRPPSEFSTPLIGAKTSSPSLRPPLRYLGRYFTFLDLGILPSWTDSSFFFSLVSINLPGGEITSHNGVLGKTWMDDAILFGLMHGGSLEIQSVLNTPTTAGWLVTAPLDQLQFRHVGFQLITNLLPHQSLQRPRLLTANDGGRFPIDAHALLALTRARFHFKDQHGRLACVMTYRRYWSGVRK